MEEEPFAEQTEPPSSYVDVVERGGILGWASYVSFHWAGRFLRLGASKTLQEEDLMGIHPKSKR